MSAGRVAQPRRQGEGLRGSSVAALSRRSSAWIWRRRWLCPNWNPLTGECWGLLSAGLAPGTLALPSPARTGAGVVGAWGGTHWSPLSSGPRGRSKTNALNISQKMIEMFVRTKHKIDKCHEFALVVVNNDATWVSGAAGTEGDTGTATAPCPPHPGSSQLSGFTSDPREVCSCLYDLETVVCKSFSIPPPVGLGWGGWDRAESLGCKWSPLGANGVP